MRTKLLARPFQLIDTVAVGMTSYPFTNKWTGLDPWLPGLGRALAWAALAGLLLFAGSRAGRVLLVVLAGSLLPYSVTWKLSSEWRLTEVAYPFFLIAAFVAVGWLAGWANPARLRAVRAIPGPGIRRLVAGWAAVLVVVAGGWYAIVFALPPLAVAEQLAAGEDATVSTGGRDQAFFRDGWSEPSGTDVVTFRDALGPRADVRLRLPARDYSVTLRLDPFPRPSGETAAALPTMSVLLNRNLVGRFPLRWDPTRVGSYDFRLPRAFVRKGFNRLEIVAMPAAGGDEPAGAGGGHPTTFSIWHVRIRPVVE